VPPLLLLLLLLLMMMMMQLTLRSAVASHRNAAPRFLILFSQFKSNKVYFRPQTSI